MRHLPQSDRECIGEKPFLHFVKIEQSHIGRIERLQTTSAESTFASLSKGRKMGDVAFNRRQSKSESDDH